MLSERHIRQRRFFLFLPVLVVPFLTTAFWLMDGGAMQAQAGNEKSGLNFRLPDAQIEKDSVKDKLAFYEQAAADSLKRSEQIKNDPYHSAQVISNKQEDEIEIPVAERIRSIREKISFASPTPAPIARYEAGKPAVAAKKIEVSIEEDPEMAAINRTLDKLMALQQPTKAETARPKIPGNVFNVRARTSVETSYFGTKDSSFCKNCFLGEENPNSDSHEGLYAIVPTEQIVKSGTVVKIQVLQSIEVNGRLISEGSDLHGVVSLENNRVFITIPSIRIGNEILPVSLSVYDLDGLEGLNVPFSDVRDVLKSSTVNVLSLDPSIKTQAAIAGIGAAQNLLSRRARAVTAAISSGYRVLLKNNKIQ